MEFMLYLGIMSNYFTLLLKTIVKLFLMLSIQVQKEEVMDVLFVWKEMQVPVFKGYVST